MKEFNPMQTHISFAIQSSSVKIEILLVFLCKKGKIETPKIHEIWDFCLRLVGKIFSQKNPYFNQTEGTVGLHYDNRQNSYIP